MQLAVETIAAELRYFEQYFSGIFKGRNDLLGRILIYLAKWKGKQIRPMFVLLCARLGGSINDQSYRAALFVEMLHTSSLVHDDLVDNSLQRRGAYSVNALWKEKAAVLVGDYLFTKSILLLLASEDHQILKIFSGSIGKVIECELLQMDRSRRLNVNEDVYFEIIKGKTATLLAAACAAGAASTFEDDHSIENLYQFGEKLGIAFQIKDDLLDYGTADIGKPTGNDIKERKITLPLIYTLNNCTPSLRKSLMYIIKHKNTDQESVAYLIEEVKKHKGISYAEQKMLQYRDEALELLYTFPASTTRSALEDLVFFVTNRAN